MGGIDPHPALSSQGPAGYKGMVGTIGVAGRPVSALPPLPGAAGAGRGPCTSLLSPCLSPFQGREGPKGPPGDPGEKGDLVGNPPRQGGQRRAPCDADAPFSPGWPHSPARMGGSAWGASMGISSLSQLRPLHREGG